MNLKLIATLFPCAGLLIFISAQERRNNPAGHLFGDALALSINFDEEVCTHIKLDGLVLSKK